MARQLISGCLQLLKDMAGPMISGVLGQLGSTANEMTEEEVKAIKDVEKGVENLGSELTRIQAVLVDAEKREICDVGIKDWLGKLKDVSFDIDDVLDEWNTAVNRPNTNGNEDKEGEDAPPLKKVRLSLSKLSSWFSTASPVLHDLILRRNVASKIRELNERLDAIALEQSRYNFNMRSINDIKEPERPRTTSLLDVSNVYGRDEETKVVMSKLLSESSNIIPIVGMGGIGKTTLAQLVYNDNRVKGHFEKRMWICVSDPFDEIRVAKAIIEALSGCATNLVELESLLNHIHESIEGKRFLLVLDDVWTDDATKWKPLEETLKTGARESRILVTTRKKEVAIMMRAEQNMISIDLLSDELCWSIFSQLAFFGREGCRQLEDIGKQIANKCKGLPLVAKNLGGLMRYKTSIQQWKDVLDSELWELENDDDRNSMFTPFLLSYSDLPCVEKNCLSYCSIFPNDYVMDKGNLIQLWMSQGYLNESKTPEKEGQDCFENLAMRSFFQDFRKGKDGNVISCKMHGIMHDFLRFLAKNECSVIDVKEKMERIGKRTRHSTLYLKRDHEDTLRLMLEIKGLRTLFILSPYIRSVNSSSLERLFWNLTCLRTLNLPHGAFEQLPKGIERLFHLRYLNLSSNSCLTELPNSLCDLFNLQTLRVKKCLRLVKLPNEIGKLVSLRHLYINGCVSLKHLPKGIAKLSSLRTLDMFVVPHYDCLTDYIDTLELQDLHKLKELQGSMFVRDCGNLRNWSQAERAPLKDKEHLLNLQLQFNTLRNGEAHDEILEALEPHPNLESLCIRYYRSSTICPNWMVVLINLKRLRLVNGFNCKFLPPFGKFPSLESLDIVLFFKGERVGVEFLGIENDDNGEPRRHQISFPKLKDLSFRGLSNWRKWESGTNSGEAEEENNCLTIMPSLHFLEIVGCKRLTALPDFLQKTPLQHLLIRRCPILKERCREGVGADWPKISHITNVQLRDS